VVTKPLHAGHSYPTGSPVRVCNTVSAPLYLAIIAFLGYARISTLLELGDYSSVVVISGYVGIAIYTILYRCYNAILVVLRLGLQKVLGRVWFICPNFEESNWRVW
jgi:hypothetical protein